MARRSRSAFCASCLLDASGRRRVDVVNVSEYAVASMASLAIRHRDLVATTNGAFSGRHARESQSHEVAKTHAQDKTTGPGPARARGGLARGTKRPNPGHFDLVLGHDAAAVAAARAPSAPFAHGGTWVPRAVWAAPPRRKAPKASLVCGALRRPNTTKPLTASSRRGRRGVISI